MTSSEQEEEEEHLQTLAWRLRRTAGPAGAAWPHTACGAAACSMHLDLHRTCRVRISLYNLYIHGSPLALNWTLRKRDYLCRIGCVLTVLTWTHVGCILLEATSGGPGLDEDRTGVVAYAPPA